MAAPKPKPMGIVPYIEKMNTLYGNSEPDAGVRYVPREERIQHHLDTLEVERSKRRNARFI